MAESSDTLKTILLVGAIGVGGYFIYQRFFKGRQGTGVASGTSGVAGGISQAPTITPQVVQGQVQIPSAPSTQQGLSALAAILQAAPPQPIQITAPTLEAAKAAAAEFAQYQTPLSTQLQNVAAFLQQYPTAQVQVVSSFNEAELPPPPPGEYFTYGVIPETGTPIVYYAPQAPGIVVGGETPPPPPPG